jgi:YVTN family beta-propeller protein
MAHFIDASTYELIDNVLVGSHPHYAEFSAVAKTIGSGRTLGNHIAIIDVKQLEVEKYLLVGQRVWQLALPDDKLLFTTNGNSNDVSVIDVPRLTVMKPIPVGAWRSCRDSYR